MKRKVSVVLSAAMAATTIMAQGVPAYAAPEIRPYGNVEAELDFDHSYQGTVTDEYDVTSVNLESGDYFSTHSVNFSQGVSKITLKIKGTGAGIIELRKGDKDGDKIGNVKYTATDEFKEYDLSVSGIDDLDAIAFVNVAGSCLVDSWTAEPGSTVDEPDQPDAPDQPDVPDQPDTPDQPEIPDVPDEPDQPQTGTVNPYGRVEAENFADSSVDAKVVPNKESVLINDGGYVIAENVDFSKGLSEVKVYAKSTKPMVKLGVYVDGTNTLLGEINIGTDMTSATSLDVTSALSGKHNVYFRAKGGSVQLDAWEVSEGSGTVEQPPVEEPPVSGGVNPYDTVVAKDHVDEKKDAMVTPMGATVNILSEGGYFAVKDVNLSKGISSFTVKAGATVASVFEIRLDKVDGDKLAAFKVSTESKEIKINALSDVSGKHTLYFVATKGKGINIDSWKAEAGQGTVVTPPVEEPPVSGGINPYETVEVEKVSAADGYRSKENTIVAPKKNAITLMNEGAYVIAKDVNFTSGVSEFTISTATKTSGLLEIKLDSVTGTNIASVRLDKTDDAFKTATVKVNSTVTGKHDVYFVLKMGTGCTLDSWKATAASGTVEQPPVVEPPVSGAVNPYQKVEAEASAELNFAMLAPNKQSVIINKNGYAVAKNV
ncbi:carbohydrate-binding protein, partial [Butyrivibrio sp. INlla21]|uniref:carbohydrate-binding protein n=1 Tax=Butyrivibrio sp. INlla21 TaxID=1520811 RepID=UPI0008E8C0EA